MESWSAFSVLLTALAVVAITKCLSIFYNQLTHWKKLNVPHLPAMPGLGSGWRLFLRRISFVDYCLNMYNKYPEARYVGLMDFATPTVAVRDPELIKEIAVKSFENFPDHRSFISEEMDPIFGRNVFSLRGEQWREMRNTLSPSFTASKMRFMFELVSKCSHEFVEYLAEHPEWSAEMDSKDVFTRYTNDVIATVAFGISVHSLKERDNEFYVRGKDVTKFSGFWNLIKFILFRMSPRLMRFLGLKAFSPKSMKFFRNTITETVKVRDEKVIVRPDMIHLLMQARDKNTTVTPMTVDDIVAQAFIFFLAGFDTSSTLMCFMAHELAMNPDIQEKLREEVLQHMENGEIAYETLSKLEYMEMVISETLRKYPPVAVIDRVCARKFTLPPPTPEGQEVTMQPDSMIWFPVYAIHHDPKYFPNPDKFDPERFNEKNKEDIVPYSYMPFGLGPRKCIGNRFALMETKILIAHLLQKFVIKPTEKTHHPIVMDKKTFILQPVGGFWVGLEKREVQTNPN